MPVRYQSESLVAYKPEPASPKQMPEPPPPAQNVRDEVKSFKSPILVQSSFDTTFNFTSLGCSENLLIDGVSDALVEPLNKERKRKNSPSQEKLFPLKSHHPTNVASANSEISICVVNKQIGKTFSLNCASFVSSITAMSAS